MNTSRSGSTVIPSVTCPLVYLCADAQREWKMVNWQKYERRGLKFGHNRLGKRVHLVKPSKTSALCGVQLWEASIGAASDQRRWGALRDRVLCSECRNSDSGRASAA